MPAHLCDVVIATRNRPQALRRCLAGLRTQRFRDFGIIVVDDASDPPVHIDGGTGEGLDLTVLRLDSQSGPAAARNAGVAVSGAKYIAFIDDDVLPDWRLLEVHLGAVKGGGEPGRAVVSSGPFVQPADWRPTPWNLWEARQARHEAESMLQGLYTPTWRQFHTGNNMLARQTFLDAGGFDGTFKRAEDDEFALRLHQAGCEFVFQSDAIAWHYSERSLEAWLTIPRAYAHFDMRIDSMYPSEGYLRVKQEELGERSLALRILRAATRRHGRPQAIAATTVAARLLFRLRLDELSMMALSAAYDLSYAASLEDELEARARATAAATSAGTGRQAESGAG